MDVRILVTGAAGFIGSHLCERLVREGHEVRGIDSFTDYYEVDRKNRNLDPLRDAAAFRLEELDLLDADLDGLLEDVDAIFHLAAQPGVRGSWGERFETYLRNNVLATQRLLEGLRTHSIRTVYASSSSVYGLAARLPTTEDDRPQPISPYGVTKLAAEHLAVLYARAYSVPVTSVRYFTVFGPRQRPDMAFTHFIEATLTGRPIEVLGTGEQTRDFTYVDDAVDATIRALDAPPGAVYNVGGGNRASINEAIGLIRELTGREPDVRHRDPVAGDPSDTSADTTRIRTELGWEPHTSLRDGLAAQVEWARKRMG